MWWKNWNFGLIPYDDNFQRKIQAKNQEMVKLPAKKWPSYISRNMANQSKPRNGKQINTRKSDTFTYNTNKNWKVSNEAILIWNRKLNFSMDKSVSHHWFTHKNFLQPRSLGPKHFWMYWNEKFKYNWRLWSEQQIRTWKLFFGEISYFLKLFPCQK